MTVSIIKAVSYLLLASILFCAIMFGVYILVQIAYDGLGGL